jgi:hypothetical protein
MSPTQAKVERLDALEAMRSALIQFIARARQQTNETLDNVRRTRIWLAQDRRPFWEAEIRRRRRALDEAEAALFSARMSPLRDKSFKQEEDVRRARAAVAEAEEKLQNVKRWNRDFDSVVEPMTRPVERFHETIDQELPKGVLFLTNAIKTLEDYTQMRAPTGEAAPAPADQAEPPQP